MQVSATVHLCAFHPFSLLCEVQTKTYIFKGHEIKSFGNFSHQLHEL